MTYDRWSMIYNPQCNAMQCNAMQCNAMQCNAMQCNAMQCNEMQCKLMQCNAIYIDFGFLRNKNRKNMLCIYAAKN